MPSGRGDMGVCRADKHRSGAGGPGGRGGKHPWRYGKRGGRGRDCKLSAAKYRIR
ncbi:hypothetical protein GCM10028824_14200 [Hymenobacter segetis]